MSDTPTATPPLVNPAANMQSRLAAIHAKVASEQPGAQPQPPAEPVVPVEAPPPAVGSSFAPAVTTDATTDLDLDLPMDAPEQATAPPAESELEEPSTIDKIAAAAEGKGNKKDIYENLKRLRTKSKHQEEELSTKDNLLKELTRKVEQYESGEVLPEPVQQLQGRVKELEQYERLHALRLSPEYEAKYVAPLEESIATARKFAEDYQIDPNVLDEARGLENKKERNKYLRKHLDEVATLEAVSILDGITNLETEIEAAEAEPARAMETLKEERSIMQREQEETRITKIKTNAREGWKDALTELRASGEYPEVTLTGDADIDAHIKPILEGASKEYGKIITALGSQQVKELPKEATKVLAKWALMAHSAALMANSRAEHYKHSKDIIDSNKRYNPMLRPQIGQSNGFGGHANGADGAPPKITAQNAAEALRNRVLPER